MKKPTVDVRRVCEELAHRNIYESGYRIAVCAHPYRHANAGLGAEQAGTKLERGSNGKSSRLKASVKRRLNTVLTLHRIIELQERKDTDKSERVRTVL